MDKVDKDAERVREYLHLKDLTRLTEEDIKALSGVPYITIRDVVIEKRREYIKNCRASPNKDQRILWQSAEVRKHLAGKRLEDITVEEDLLRFPDVSFHNVLRVLGEEYDKVLHINEKGYVDFFGPNIKPMSEENKELYISFLKAHPHREDIAGLVRRHMEPLGLARKEGYRVRYGKPALTNSMHDMKYEKTRIVEEWANKEGKNDLAAFLRSMQHGSIPQDIRKQILSLLRDGGNDDLYFPGQYQVDVTVTKKEGSALYSFTEPVFVEIKELKIDPRVQVKWEARSSIQSREWVDAKLAHESEFCLVVGFRNIEEAKRYYKRLLREKEVTFVNGLDKQQVDQIDGSIILADAHNLFDDEDSHKRKRKKQHPLVYAPKPEKTNQEKLLDERTAKSRVTG